MTTRASLVFLALGASSLAACGSTPAPDAGTTNDAFVERDAPSELDAPMETSDAGPERVEEIGRASCRERVS
jgi:hypothetical protein